MNSPRFSPPSRSYNGYIFDCDGTLADTMPLHFSAWRHALNKAGATFEFSWQLFTSRAGMSLPLTVEELSAQFNIQLDPDAVARSQYEHYRALENQVKPVPGVLEFARDVAKRAPISVASGSSRESVERTLSTIGARDLFEILVTPESVEHGKPAPDMFLLAAKLMQVPAQDCLVLEDAEFGFEAARRAQMDYAIVRSDAPLHL